MNANKFSRSDIGLPEVGLPGISLPENGSSEMFYEILRKNEDLWDMFTRKEEYSSKRLDNHNRFTHASSGHKDILNPVLSRYLIDSGFKVEYPEKKKFAICLTHDVDEIYPPFSHTVLSSLHHIKNLNLSGLKNQLLWRQKGKEASPYWNFKEIMALEKKHNAKSSFYFLADERDIRRFRYNVEALENEIGFIADEGWDVGLHGGYYAYDDLQEIKKEKDRLEKLLGRNVIGYRNHYLRFKTPDTWKHLAEAGFKYDTTFGYEDMIGFRNGMCHPFRPYNLNAGQYVDVLEIPLCIMDTTLWGLRPHVRSAWETVETMMKIVESHSGVLTLLWHNNMFNCPFRTPLSRLYIKILSYAESRGAWIASAEDIWKWWHGY
jgi:peptidoglycan/xylan/chitin deacetylase (PgdA/CDA1 family)